MTENIYSTVVAHITHVPGLKALMLKGRCHEWTGEALVYIQEDQFCREHRIVVEAREVFLSYSLSHTFIRLLAHGEKPYILDGTGVENHGPYFGYEESAPPHLQHSRLDIISVLSQLEIRK